MGHAELTIHDQAATKRISLDEYWMPFTPNRDFKADPKMVVRAEGMYYWNDRGDKLIDASSGLFCANAGHGRKEIAEAVGNQMRELDFVPPFLRAHPKQFELATRVAELTPGDLNRIFFTNSGSEAVETAMKVALAYHQARGQSGRNVFISRERAYHGVNFGGVALSGLVNNRRKFGPGLPGIAHMRHTHLKENLFTKGEGAHGVELAEDLHALRQSLRRREHRSVFRRADRRLDGLPRAAEGLPEAPARDLRRARHPARIRRGDLRLRTHRRGVRGAELRRDTRSHDDGQGPHQRRAADGRGRDFRAHPRYDHGGGARRRDRVLPRLHVFRPPAARVPQDLRRSTSTRRRASSSAVASCRRISWMRSSRSRTCRRWPTSAAMGCSRTIDVHPAGGPGARGHALQKRLFDNGLHLKTTGDSAIIAPPLIAEKHHVDTIADILRKTLATI